MDDRTAARDACPPFSGLLSLHQDTTSGGVPCLYGSLDSDQEATAAFALACNIASRRLRNDRIFVVWHRRAAGETDDLPGDVDGRVLAATLLENVGTPAAPAAPEHLHGLIAEAIWLNVVADTDVGLGTPLRVEGHDWSATDPGGDGLTIYVDGDGYCYRLWESKYHGSEGPIRDTVNGACRQVGTRALSYLARFSLVEQYLTEDQPLATFYGRLAELWADKDPAAGVGIVVGSDRSRNEEECFERITEYFELPADQHQGHLNFVGDFPAFAESVRRVLWRGCGLWTEP